MTKLKATNQVQNKVGLLGGMSPVATMEYYRLINAYVREFYGGYTSAEMIINSVNFGNIEGFVRQGKWELAGSYLAGKARELEAGGAEFILMATNTMHKVRAQIKAAIQIPFIDIFETVGAEINRKSLSKVGMLGTYPVMSDSFYKETFTDLGIELISPVEVDKKEIDRILFEELTKNEFLPASKAFFIDVMHKLASRGCQGIILGCTEIKLLVAQQDIPQIPLFDTTTLHCQRAAKLATGQAIP